MPVTALRFRERGLEEFWRWMLFLLGRGAGGEALLAGKPTWQGWASPGLGVEQRSTPSPAPAWLPLGPDLGWGATKNELLCIACLFCRRELNVGTTNQVQDGV